MIGIKFFLKLWSSQLSGCGKLSALFWVMVSALAVPCHAQANVFLSDQSFMRGGVTDVNGNGPDPSDPPFVSELQEVFNLSTESLETLAITPWTASKEKSLARVGNEFSRVFPSFGRSRMITQKVIVTSNQTIEFSETAVNFVTGVTESKKTGTISLLDQSGDGNSDGFSVEFEGQTTTVDFVFADIDGDDNPDAVTIPWSLTVLAALGADVDDETPEEHPIYLPIGDVGGGARTVALDLNGDGNVDPGSPVLASLGGATGHNLYFAQFGEGKAGGVQLSSDFLLANPNNAVQANATILINGDDGSPLTQVDLNGQVLSQGKLEVSIPTSGLRILGTDGQGPITAGSATVTSDQPLTGVIVFSGTVGAAGVGSGLKQSTFVAPIVTNATTNTGIAMMNPGENQVTINLQLIDREGNLLATASKVLSAKGHLALFVNEITWQPEPGVNLDLTEFEGVLKGSTSAGQITATVLQTRPNQFITMPVAIPTQVGGGELYFPQFGDGEASGVQISSEVILLNLNNTVGANVSIVIRGDDGNPLAGIDLNGEVLPEGKLDLNIPAGGLRILRTDGKGTIAVGSAIVTSDQPLGGVIIFDSTTGAAGVASSFRQSAFVAPMVTKAPTNTGIAIMNPGVNQVTVNLQLIDREGNLLATASRVLSAKGHLALFVNEIAWQPEAGINLDFTDFEGLLKGSTSDAQITATVIQTQSNEFVTMPVGLTPK